MHSQKKPSSGTVGTIFSWGLAPKFIFPLAVDVICLFCLLGIYVFNFLSTCDCFCPLSSMFSIRIYKLRELFSFSFSQSKRKSVDLELLSPFSCFWHCFYSWDCVFVSTAQKDSVMIQRDFLPFETFPDSELPSFALAKLWIICQPNRQSCSL